MDFNATIDLIIKDLAEAGEIIDDLKRYPGVPAFQVEFAKSKCKSASEVISFLKTLSGSIQVSQELPVEPQPEPEPQPQPQSAPQPKPQSKPKPKPEPQPQPKPQPPLQESFIVADKFTNMSASFNEQLGELIRDNDGVDLNKKMQVSHLTEAIGVNDRFLFIREIFNDNQEAYTLAISKLESVENIMDAREIVMSYTGGNIDNEAANQLLDLVKQKLSSDE
jgi:hypothetical protein